MKYAKEAADYIGGDHTEVIISQEEVLSWLEAVIALPGTFDITTVRAGIGMYLACKAIHETTGIRALLTDPSAKALANYGDSKT